MSSAKVAKRIVHVNISKCPQNHPCPAVHICPAGALTQKGYDAPLVDAAKCILCAKCVTFCPKGALVLG